MALNPSSELLALSITVQSDRLGARLGVAYRPCHSGRWLWHFGPGLWHLEIAARFRLVSFVLGVLSLIYCTYSLVRPTIKPVQAGGLADISVDFVNGILGGLTGLAGIAVVVWCQLRAWPKDIQRTISQSVTFAAFVVSAIPLSVAGQVATETIHLYLLGLPFALGGTWLGLKLFGRFDDAGFRRIVLLLLLASGISLIVLRSILVDADHAWSKGVYFTR